MQRLMDPVWRRLVKNWGVLTDDAKRRILAVACADRLTRAASEPTVGDGTEPRVWRLVPTACLYHECLGEACEVCPVVIGLKVRRKVIG